MVMLRLIQWWYSAGLALRFRRMGAVIDSQMDFFSLSLLLRTLFSPFRQISVGSVQGPLSVKLQALFDKLTSRVIGAMIRTAVLIAGCITITLTLVIQLLLCLGWLVLPFALPLSIIIVLMIGVSWLK